MHAFYIALGLIALSAISAGIYYSQNLIEEDTYNNKHLLHIGSKNPVMWLYYDQSDVNGRLWADFGARSSRVINTPYLNLCYESIVKHNGRDYTVKVLAGLSDVALLLGGWKELPKALQNPIAPVGEAELNYIRATVLRRFGGLWINPSCIFMKPLPKLGKKVVFFGTNKDESYSDKKGTPVPSTDIMYSPVKNHPIFIELETRALKRIEHREGGKQFRRDINLDLTKIFEDHIVTYMPNVEFARKHCGRRIQLEDLLGSGNIPVPHHAIYAPLDWSELQTRRNFGWFLRMSETQILESDLLVTKLFTINVMSHDQLIEKNYDAIHA